MMVVNLSALAVDEDGQHELTEQRVSTWCQQLLAEINEV